MKRATALSVKITARDMEVSSSSALTTGATAAIALPPQIAVPALIRYDNFGSIPKARPRSHPMVITPITDTMVNMMPSFPAARDS